MYSNPIVKKMQSIFLFPDCLTYDKPPKFIFVAVIKKAANLFHVSFTASLYPPSPLTTSYPVKNGLAPTPDSMPLVYPGDFSL